MKTKTGVLTILVLVLGYLLLQFATSQSVNKTTTVNNTQKAIVTVTLSPTLISTSLPAPSPTLTSSPTPAPSQPPVALQGRLFFDIDVSGKQNEIQMKYYEGLIRPKNTTIHQNPDLVKVLEEYKVTHPAVNDGKRITIMEPGLSNIEVCASVAESKVACVLTDEQGDFTISGTTIRSGDFVGLNFTDKSEGPAPKMAYQNRFVRPVAIPAYEVDGIKVPEQNLSQTHLMKISNIYYVMAGEKDISIGLMQGALPYPPMQGEPYIFSFFDHDPRVAWGLDWRGRTALIPKSYNQLPNKLTDHLDGVDIGGQKGDFVLSVGFGMATVKKSETMGNQVIVMVDNFPHNITYSHLDTVLISGTQEVFTGMIIGVVGRTGKNVGAPHIHLDVGSSGYDPFGDPKGSYEQLWTRAFSPVEFQ
jgi:hypothetical protein